MSRKRIYLDEVDGPQDPPKKKSPKELVESIKGTNYDPTVQFKDEVLIGANIQENPNAKAVGDYFKSYVESPGVHRIWGNQLRWYGNYHPRRNSKIGRFFYGNPKTGMANAIVGFKNLDTNGVYDIDASVVNSQNAQRGNNKYTIIGLYDDVEDEDHPEGFVLPHELTHRLPYGKLSGAQADALDRNQNTIINGHDELREEKYSDLQGLRFLLYDEGIYDSRSKKDATPEDIQKLRDKYPQLRPLKQMDNNKAAWMINHVVQNNNNDLYRRSLKHGGIYIKPSHRGRFTALKERTGHSTSWFKEHGTPAQKKMATFALNAAKWKH